ncbi:MAG: hypothetical protein MMC33_003928 [Icmadophila ericetorum]|nr:hypothetical protein [Icmadophila ericetorum]
MSSSNPYPSIGSNNHHPAKSRLHSPVGTGAIVLLMLVVLACLISYAVYRTQAWYTNNRKRLEAPPSGRWQKGHTNECWQSRCLRLIAVWCGSVEGKPKICRVGVADLPEPSQHAWDIDREVMFPFGCESSMPF